MFPILGGMGTSRSKFRGSLKRVAILLRPRRWWSGARSISLERRQRASTIIGGEASI